MNFLDGVRVTLRPIAVSDYQRLRDLDLSLGLDSRHNGPVPAPQDYGASLWIRDVLDHKLACLTDGRELGLLTAYRFSARNQYCWLALYGYETARSNGSLMLAAALYISYLFSEWPLRKLYVDARGDIQSVYAHTLGLKYFTSESTLEDYSTALGSHSNRSILSVTRAQWNEISATWLHREVRTSDAGPQFR